MFRLIVSLVFVGLTAGACDGGPDKPIPYPDLSEPKAAAFSLGIALAEGDAKTVRFIYVGDQQEFSELVDAVAKTIISAKKFSKAADTTFGKNAATLVAMVSSSEIKIGNSPITALIAAAKVKQNGDEATLTLADSIEIRLTRKKNGEWKVIEWPALPPEIIIFANVHGSVCEKLAGDIDRGVFKKAHEVFPAFGLALKTQLLHAIEKDHKKK
jgi:hypothetical protein